jgi:hypothetical protein
MIADIILGLGVVWFAGVIVLALWLWANNPPAPPPSPAELDAQAAAELAELRRRREGPWEVPVEIELPARGTWTPSWRPRRPFDHERHLL